MVDQLWGGMAPVEQASDLLLRGEKALFNVHSQLLKDYVYSLLDDLLSTIKTFLFCLVFSRIDSRREIQLPFICGTGGTGIVGLHKLAFCITFNPVIELAKDYCASWRVGLDLKFLSVLPKFSDDGCMTSEDYTIRQNVQIRNLLAICYTSQELGEWLVDYYPLCLTLLLNQKPVLSRSEPLPSLSERGRA